MVGLERIQPAQRRDWRAWLEANHDTSPGVWVVQWRAATGRQLMSYDALVVPADLLGAPSGDEPARQHYDAFPSSAKRAIL